MDATNNPLRFIHVKFDALDRPSFKLIGEKATYAINPETGKLTTTYPTGSKVVTQIYTTIIRGG